MRFSTCASLLAAVVVVGSTSVVGRRYESDSVLARDGDLELEAREEAIDNYVRELESKLAARGLDSEDITQVVRDLSDIMPAVRRDTNTIDLEARGGTKKKNKKKKSKARPVFNFNAPTINIGHPDTSQSSPSEPVPVTHEHQPQGQGLTETPARRGFEGTLGRRSGSSKPNKQPNPNKQRRRRELAKSKKTDDTDIDNSVSEPINEAPKLKARGGESESGGGGRARKPGKPKKQKKQQQMPKQQQRNGQDPNETVGKKKKAAKHKPGETEEEFYSSLSPEEKKVETLSALADQKQNPSRRALEDIILAARDFFDLNEELDARAPKERDFS